MKNIYILLILFSHSTLAEESSLPTHEEVVEYQRLSHLMWTQISPNFMQKVMSTDPDKRHRASEIAFLQRPIGGIPTPLELQNIIDIRDKYIAEKSNLPKDIKLEERQALLNKYSVKLNAIELQSRTRSNFGLGSPSNTPQVHPLNRLNASFNAYGLNVGINCHPSNNFKFCISDQGVRYERVGNGDLGDRIDKNLTENTDTNKLKDQNFTTGN